MSIKQLENDTNKSLRNGCNKTCVMPLNYKL